jgi:hypothetical protein
LGEAAPERAQILEAGRSYGAGLGEWVIETYGFNVTGDAAQQVADRVCSEVLGRVHEIWVGGMPTMLALMWGHEVINAVQDRILEHLEYVQVAAKLVAFDPALALKTRDSEGL